MDNGPYPLEIKQTEKVRMSSTEQVVFSFCCNKRNIQDISVLIEREQWSMPVLFQNSESPEQLCQVLLEQTKKVLSSEQQKQQTVVGADLM